jgi:hypothetical protein
VTSTPAGELDQEELKMDGFNHPKSVSDVRQVLTFKHDRVFGHYGIDAAPICGKIIADSYSHGKRIVGSC